MVTTEERQVLHMMLDKLCDEEQPSIMWETFFRGEEPFTMKRKRIWLSMRISDDIERR